MPRQARGHGAQHRPRGGRGVGAQCRADGRARPARPPVIVLKFGGTSVTDAAAFRRAAAIVESRRARSPIVVVSALGGATNILLEIAAQSAGGQLILALRSVEALRERHL
ncbi:MAG: hypothetical protein KGO03_13595, partial [Gemmatimonadota bacterium]|nr:hypothetical protein [Gemmatimonadota bacterium]